jgi:hypothetical protein
MLTSNRPLRVAVLCSRRAPGLLHLLESDPNRGRLFDIACVMTSERDFAESDAVSAAGVQVLRHPIAEFCAARSAPV